MLKRLYGLLLLSLVFVLSANADDARLTAKAAYDFIQSNDVAIIDVREPHEYMQEHIDGSINIPLSTLSMNDVSKLQILKDEGKDIILYCRSGRRSLIAAKQFEKWGFDAPTPDIEGGILAWLSEGLPVVH